MSESQPVLWTAIFALLYFVPTVVAYLRGIKTPQGPILLNIFLGWTILGWIAALIWAACAPVAAPAANSAPGTNAAMLQLGRSVRTVRSLFTSSKG